MGQIEDIFATVDEELEQDRVHKYWKENQDWIITSLVLFFIFLCGYAGWQEYRKVQDQNASELYAKAMQAFQGEQWGAASKEMQPLLEQYDSHGYGRLGRLLQARSLVAAGDRDGAVRQLESLAADEGAPPELRDAALINAALVALDKPDQARALLARLPANSGFRPQALELQGLLAATPGEALAHYQEALALQPPKGLKDRLTARVERLAAAPSQGK